MCPCAPTVTFCIHYTTASERPSNDVPTKHRKMPTHGCQAASSGSGARASRALQLPHRAAAVCRLGAPFMTIRGSATTNSDELGCQSPKLPIATVASGSNTSLSAQGTVSARRAGPAEPRQSLQNPLNRAGLSFVYKTVCWIFLCPSQSCSARVSWPSFASLNPQACRSM